MAGKIEELNKVGVQRKVDFTGSSNIDIPMILFSLSVKGDKALLSIPQASRQMHVFTV